MRQGEESRGKVFLDEGVLLRAGDGVGIFLGFERFAIGKKIEKHE